jgi:hypothetical protein
MSAGGDAGGVHPTLGFSPDAVTRTRGCCAQRVQCAATTSRASSLIGFKSSGLSRFKGFQPAESKRMPLMNPTHHSSTMMTFPPFPLLS